MSQTLRLELPDAVYRPAKRTAEAIRRPVEEVIVNILLSALPSLEGLAPDLVEELTTLETATNERLQRVMFEQAPLAQQRRLRRLLQKNQAGTLSVHEQMELEALQKEADRVMLRKARAAVLLKWRGRRIPTLEELRKLRKRR